MAGTAVVVAMAAVMGTEAASAAVATPEEEAAIPGATLVAAPEGAAGLAELRLVALEAGQKPGVLAAASAVARLEDSAAVSVEAILAMSVVVLPVALPIPILPAALLRMHLAP